MKENDDDKNDGENKGSDAINFCFLHDVTIWASWEATIIVFHRDKAPVWVNDASSVRREMRE